MVWIRTKNGGHKATEEWYALGMNKPQKTLYTVHKSIWLYSEKWKMIKKWIWDRKCTQKYHMSVQNQPKIGKFTTL